MPMDDETTVPYDKPGLYMLRADTLQLGVTQLLVEQPLLPLDNFAQCLVRLYEPLPNDIDLADYRARECARGEWIAQHAWPFGTPLVIALMPHMSFGLDHLYDIGLGHLFQGDDSCDLRFVALRRFLSSWAERTGLFADWPTHREKLLELIDAFSGIESDPLSFSDPHEIKRALRPLLLEWAPKLVRCMVDGGVLDLALVDQLCAAVALDGERC